MKKKIRIILPIFNEGETVQNFYNELKQAILKISNYHIKILFVLDKSSDDTEDKLKKIINNDEDCDALIMSARFGHQECLYAGIEYSQDFDAVITMDADFQHPIESIKDILNAYEKNFNIVNMLRYNNNKSGLVKRLGTSLFYNLAKIFDLKNLKKNSAEFRLLDQKVIKSLMKHQEKDIFLRGIVSNLGYKQEYLNYDYKERKFGSTKYNSSSLIYLAINALTSFSSKPLFFVFFFGLVFFLISIILIISYIIDYYFIHINTLPPGYTTIVLLILLFGSMQIFFIGIIGIYLSKIFKEIKNRPRYLVEKFIKGNDKK